MKKSALLFTCFLFLSILVVAQSGDREVYAFKNYVPAGLLAKIDVNNIDKHVMGTEVSKKLKLVNITYTYKVVDGGSEITKYKKAAIFFSIRKMDAYYRKGVKKGYINAKEATTKFERCLDIGLALFPQKTAALEAELKNMKGAPQIIELFESIELN